MEQRDLHVHVFVLVSFMFEYTLINIMDCFNF